MREQLAAMLVSGLTGLPGGGAPAGAPVLSMGLSLDGTPRLMVQPVSAQESIYAPESVSDYQGGYNEGALSLEINGRYMTDYIFRGLEIVEPQTHEDAVNLQLEADLRLDLGRLPDPFFHIVTNTAEGDDISNFQVIRPSVGLEWETEAFEVAVGTQSFTYPDRNELDTGEVFVDLQLNDGFLYSRDEPLLGPFVFAAYDFDRFEGLYIEGGLRRDFAVADTNLRFRLEGLVAYVNNFELYSATPESDGSGFSHYQVGLLAEYRLNSLLNISRRYGQWSAAGYLYYTDGIDNELAATSQIWGGAGITFRY